MENQQGSIGKQIGRTAKKIRRELDLLYDANFGEEGITRQQARVLRYLHEHPNATAFDVQQEFFLVKSSTSDLLNGLAKRRLIEHRKAEEDRRRKTIALTEAGREFVYRVSVVFSRFEEALSASISAEEKDELSRLLDKVEAGLGAKYDE